MHEPTTGVVHAPESIPPLGEMIPSAELAEPGDGTAVRRRADRLRARWSAVIMWVVAALILASAVFVAVRVFARYVVNHDLVFGDDFLSLLFIWMIFLGIPRSILEDNAPRLGLATRLVARSPVQAERLVGFQLGLTAGFFAYMVVSAVALLPDSLNTSIATLGVPQYVETLAPLVGGVLGALATALRGAAVGVRRQGLASAGAGVALVAVLLFAGLPAGLSTVVALAIILAVDAPVAVALAVAGSALITSGVPGQLATPASQLMEGPKNLALLAIPLFMLMGGLVARSRLAEDLSRFIRALLGWLPGGVGVASIGTAGVFANMSGSAVADSAAIGTVFLPQLRKSGYKAEEAAALQASAGVLGIIFPPAIAMILYGTVANLDIVSMFKAVVIPGFMVAGFIAVVVVIRAARSPSQQRVPFSARELARSVPPATPALLIPVILDVGIFSGVFTPAESGAVASLVAFVLVLLARGLTARQARAALEQAVDGTMLVMFILVCVTVLDYGFTTSGLQAHVTDFLALAGNSPLACLLLINLAFLVVHMFVETAPSILVLVPLVLPAALSAGVDPLQLGAVIAVNSTIGLILPPVGVSLYVVSQIAGVEPLRVVRYIWPYVTASLVALLLLIFFPSIATWLPTVWH